MITPYLFHEHKIVNTRIFGATNPGHYEILPCASQRNIETSGIVQETDALVLVGPHTRQDDKVLLSALKSIHAGNFHFLHKHGHLVMHLVIQE